MRKAERTKKRIEESMHMHHSKPGECKRSNTAVRSKGWNLLLYP